MAGSDSTSPLITVGLILAVPLLNRFLRGSSPSPAPATASSSGPHTRWYSPRHFSHRLTRLARLSPSEWLLFLLFATLCSYHISALNPFGQARRASKDLFLHTGLPIGASSASLRAKVASLSLDEVGLTKFAEEAIAAGDMGDGGAAGGPVDLGGMSAGAGVGGDVLERLLRRLNSMGARQTYLLLGPSPLLECTYCSHPSDHQLYALPPILVLYALHALALGLLTASATTLHSFDSLRGGSSSLHPASSSHWRSTISFLLPILAGLEISVIFDWYGWTEDQRSLWNHWHSNVYLARHTLLLLLSAAVYLYPRLAPNGGQKAAPAASIAQRLALLNDCVARTASNVALLDVGREAIWRDQELRSAVGGWHDEQQRQLQNGDGPQEGRNAGALRLKEAQEKGWIQRTPEEAFANTREHVWRRIDDARGEGQPQQQQQQQGT